MDASQSDSAHDPMTPPNPRRVDDIVSAYLDRLNRGDKLDPFDILSDYPDIGPDILEKIETFIELGSSPMEGKALPSIGDFTLRRQIGRGGMGIVYDAWQNSMDRRVALKVLPAGIAADNKTFIRFMREAKAAGQLDHANIVHVHGLGVDEKTPYFAMEFVEGETLAHILTGMRAQAHEAGARRGGLSHISRWFATNSEPARATIAHNAVAAGEGDDNVGGVSPFDTHEEDIIYYGKLAKAFAGAAEGLQHAHSKGVIHRDIKPSNLILDREGRLRILDFGLAHLEGQPSLTLSGDLLGTPLYMSPEQAMARRIPIDHRTDIYSLGATMYEMLVLEPPFHGRDHRDTLSQIIFADPSPLRRRNPHIPRDLETIVLKCLRKHPADRYGTAEALAQDLQRFLRGDPIEARPQPAWERNLRRLWRARILVSLALVSVLLMGSLAILWRQQVAEENARKEALYCDLVLSAVDRIQLDRIDNLRLAKGIVNSSNFFARGVGSFESSAEAAGITAAIDDLQAAVMMFPRRPDALYYQARGFLALGRTQEARACVESILQCCDTFVPALTLRATILQTAAREASRTHTLEPIAAVTAANPWTRAWLNADVGLASAHWHEADAAFTELLRLENAGTPTYLGATLDLRLGRGIARLEAYDFEGAKRDFTAATVEWQNALTPGVLLGLTYLLKQETAEAYSWFEALHAEASPGPFKDVLAIRICRLFFDIRPDDGRLLEWARRVTDPMMRDLALAGALLRQYRGEEALDPLNRLLTQFPENALLHAMLSHAYTAVPGQAGAAREALSMALELAPSDPLVLFLGACTYNMHGERSNALATLDRALTIDPDYEPAASMKAEVLTYRACNEEGIRTLEDFCAKRPYDSDIHRSLAKAYENCRRWEDALSHYREFLRLNPDRLDFASVRMAGILAAQRKFDDGEALYKEALRSSPDDPAALLHYANMLQSLHRRDEALAYYCRGLVMESNTDAASDFHAQMAALLREQPKPTDLTPLNVFVRHYSIRSSPDDSSCQSLQSLALAMLFAPDYRECDRALAYARLAVEKKAGPDADLLATLATIEFECGHAADAVRTLEKASSLRNYKQSHRDQLDAYRLSIVPQVVSIDSIDAVFPRFTQCYPEEERLVNAFRDANGPAVDDGRFDYLSGCNALRSNRFAEAAIAFSRAAQRSPHTDLPVLRHVECLRSSGDSLRAKAYLENLLAGTRRRSRCVWESWCRLGFLDLRRDEKTMLDEFPRAGPGINADDQAAATAAADIRWLLESLVAGSSIRINSGSATNYSSSATGVVWSADRFYVAGRPANKTDNDAPVRINGTSDESIYQSERYFPADEPRGGYRLPLPIGTYDVRLHFTEIWFRDRGSRTFAVEIEGRKVLDGYEPCSVGFASADVHTFRVEVTDGLLDIVFQPEIENPKISALEIERLATDPQNGSNGKGPTCHN